MKRLKHLIFNMFLCVLAGIVLSCITSCRKKQPPRVAHLQISTVPENASVFIYGEERAKKLRVRPGTYILKFSCPQYKDTWVKVDAQLGKTLKIHQILEPETADVMIVSTPPKVQVTLKNKKMGTTPLILHDLPCGSYTAEITKFGYSPRTLSWEVKSSTPQRLKINLASNLGLLYVISQPQNAEVLIDGTVAGHTPFKDSVEAGKRKLEIRYPGYISAFCEVYVKEQQTVRVDGIKLEVKRSSLHISSVPSQAKVTINRQLLGNTPLNLNNLLPGKYQIILEKDGFDTIEEIITLAPDTKQKFNRELSANTGGVDIVTKPAGLTIYLDGKFSGVTKPDPAKSKYSELFKIRNLRAGRHELEIFHKRGKPARRKITFSIKKGEIKPLKNVHLWVSNAVVTYLQDNSEEEGRLVQTLKQKYLFEPEPGVQKTIYKKSVKIRMLE